jgi:hypothetical protein
VDAASSIPAIVVPIAAPAPRSPSRVHHDPTLDRDLRDWADPAPPRPRISILGPATVEAGLRELQSRTGADELMITSSTWAHADRLRSYESIAEMFELTTSPASRRPSS